MERCLIYCRVSTEDQVDRYGLPAQLRACREYAKQHGYQIVQEISDDGISGAILERPGLSRLRDLVRGGSVEVVVSLDADRLSRELAHLLIIKPEIEKRARIEFVTGNFEQTPAGQMFFSIRGAISEYERKLISQRTMRGKMEKARDGLYIGGRLAYGYAVRDGQYIIDSERAEVVRRIYSQYDTGVSMREITARLRADGVPTWGGRQWGHSSVRRILINESYCGTAYYGTLRRDGTKLVPRAGGERIVIDVPAIIERSLWLRVQASLSDNRSSGRPTTAYLLRGLLWCSCGRKMSGDPGKGTRCYRCSGRDRLRHGGNICRRSVRAAALDEAIWKAVTGALCDPVALRRLVSEHYDSLRVESQQVDSMRRKIATLKQREERAISTMLELDDDHGRAVARSRYQAARDERRRLEAELARATAVPSIPADIDAITREIRGVIPALDQAERQEFLRRAVNRITWDGSEATVGCFLRQELGNMSGHSGQFISFILKAKVAA